MGQLGRRGQLRRRGQLGRSGQPLVTLVKTLTDGALDPLTLVKPLTDGAIACPHMALTLDLACDAAYERVEVPTQVQPVLEERQVHLYMHVCMQSCMCIHICVHV